MANLERAFEEYRKELDALEADFGGEISAFHPPHGEDFMHIDWKPEKCEHEDCPEERAYGFVVKYKPGEGPTKYSVEDEMRMARYNLNYNKERHAQGLN